MFSEFLLQMLTYLQVQLFLFIFFYSFLIYIN